MTCHASVLLKYIESVCAGLDTIKENIFINIARKVEYKDVFLYLFVFKLSSYA